MPYSYIEDGTSADAAFTASGKSIEELFLSSWDAALALMIENPCSLQRKEIRRIGITSETIEMLLFDFIEELLFFKDSERLLLRIEKLSIRPSPKDFTLRAVASGERVDPTRHDLAGDVKAVTMHKFAVHPAPGGWEATVVLDV